MGFNTRDFFEMGNKIGENTKSPLSYAGENVLDSFKKRETSDYELEKLKSVEDYKRNLAPTALEQSQINENEAQAFKARNPNEMSASRLNQKDKRTTELFQQLERNKTRKASIARAKTALPTIPTGIGGQINIKTQKFLGTKDPMLAEWQNLKSLLTDSTLLQTANTKGAISDQEMALFKEAAANDKVSNEPMMQEALDHLYRYIDTEEQALVNSYKHNYNEDPMQWEEMKGSPLMQGIQNSTQSGQPEDLQTKKSRLDKKLLERGWTK